MRKTTFSGLTVLGPQDSIYADGAAFTGRDRDEIDRGLKIGIKTHRHTGLPGLTDPNLPPSAAVLGSGGTIDSGLAITVGYTLEDLAGGETLLSPLAVVTTQVAMDVPLSSPEAEADYTGGSLLTDTYTYGVTFEDGAGGETPLGPTVLVTRDPGFANARIKLKGLSKGMAEAGASGWRLFRARGGGVFALIAQGDESEDTFTDDGTISPNCDVHPPTDNLNNTNKINQLQVTLPSGGVIEDAAFINLYATTTGSFGEHSLLFRVPAASAGISEIFSALEFMDSQPPDVNRSYGGADKIDPDEELIDWHWKRPVATFGDLPTEEEGAEEGDVRVVASEEKAYLFNEGEWKPWQGGGGSNELLEQAGMGFVFCGEDLTKPRPVGFACITWMTEGKGSEEPENMAEHDILVSLP